MVLLMQLGTTGTDPTGAGTLGLRSLAATLAVLALVAAAAWALRKTAESRRSRQAMMVESAVSLGERRSLVIVTVEGRRLLLGVAPNSVSLVTELGAGFSSVLAASVDAGAPDPERTGAVS
ncbi:MAG: flagellar biosynthetic protein FliO [Vicinamibacterales bacterium]